MSQDQLLVDADAMQEAQQGDLYAASERKRPGQFVSVLQFRWTAPSKQVVYIDWERAMMVGGRWRARYGRGEERIYGPEQEAPINALRALGAAIVQRVNYENEPIRLDLGKLAALFGITTWEEISEDASASVFENAHLAIKESQRGLEPGDDDYLEPRSDAYDAAVYKVEQEINDEGYRNWRGSLLRVAETELEYADLELNEPDKNSWEVEIAPARGKSWRDAANAIVDIINGVGYFEFGTLREFLDSGPYTPKDAVEKHLHTLADRAAVYGDPSPKRRFERDFDW